jgi:phage-related protein
VDSPFVAQLQEGFEGLSFSASDIARIMGVDLFTALGNLIPNMAQVQVFSDLLKGAWDLLMGVLTQITSLINVFVNALMEGAGWLGETGGATEKVKEDFDLLQGVLGTLSAALQPIIQFLGTLVGQLISGAVQLLSWIDKSGLLTSVIQFLGSIIEGVVNVVKALVNGFMEAAGLTDKNSKASKRLSDIVDGLKRIWEMLVPVLSKIAHVIGNVIGVIFNIITAIELAMVLLTSRICYQLLQHFLVVLRSISIE